MVVAPHQEIVAHRKEHVDVCLERQPPEQSGEAGLRFRLVQSEELFELVENDEDIVVGPAPAGQDLEGGWGSSKPTSFRRASGSRASSGPNAWKSARKGAGPGVHTIAAQPWGREATSPARTNDVLPAPEGPITARRRCSWSFPQSALTSCSRPKKCFASSSVNDESPG